MHFLVQPLFLDTFMSGMLQITLTKRCGSYKSKTFRNIHDEEIHETCKRSLASYTIETFKFVRLPNKKVVQILFYLYSFLKLGLLKLHVYLKTIITTDMLMPKVDFILEPLSHRLWRSWTSRWQSLNPTQILRFF